MGQTLPGRGYHENAPTRRKLDPEPKIEWSAPCQKCRDVGVNIFRSVNVRPPSLIHRGGALGSDKISD